MITGIVATAVLSLVTALTSNGVIAVTSGVTTLIQVLTFLEHLNGGNTPSNSSMGKLK